MAHAIRAELIDIVAAGNTLGESVAWNTREERLWWTDIQERRLYRYDPQSTSLTTYELPERLGSFGFVEDGERLIAAFESGFALYQPESGYIDWIARPAQEDPNVRLNDGRVDRQGRFWAGSMTEGDGEPRGKLYCLQGRQMRVHLSNIAISNSICFSPDGLHLYFADSPRRAIQRFDIDQASGTLGNRCAFAHTAEGVYPDGANVDSEGYVWNAQWSAGRVVRYAPDGRVSGEIEVPASQPTCIAFGGSRLDLLFVTSAREGLSAAELRKQPHAGDVFVYSINVRGLTDPPFAPSP